jgi:hypothetical protein
MPGQSVSYHYNDETTSSLRTGRSAPGLASLALQHAYYPATAKLIELTTIAPLTDTSPTVVIVHFLGRCFVDPICGCKWWGCALALLTLWPCLRRAEVWLLWLFAAAQLFVYLLVF